MNVRHLAIALAVASAPLLVLPASAIAEQRVYSGVFSDVAFQGYDRAAYFKEGKSVKGSQAFAAENQGAMFRFANAANLEAFKATPEMYAPQYGGF